MGNEMFLCLQIYRHLSLKTDTERIIPKLNGTFYAVRSVVHINNITISKSMFFFFAYVKTENNLLG
jgi:hypothetical protein